MTCYLCISATPQPTGRQNHMCCHCGSGPAQSVCTAASACSYLSTPASSSKPGQAVGLRPVHHQSPRAPISSASAAARSKSDCPRFRDGTMFKLGLRVAMLTCKAYSRHRLNGWLNSFAAACCRGQFSSFQKGVNAIGGQPAMARLQRVLCVRQYCSVIQPRAGMRSSRRWHTYSLLQLLLTLCHSLPAEPADSLYKLLGMHFPNLWTVQIARTRLLDVPDWQTTASLNACSAHQSSATKGHTQSDQPRVGTFPNQDNYVEGGRQ